MAFAAFIAAFIAFITFIAFMAFMAGIAARGKGQALGLGFLRLRLFALRAARGLGRSS